MKPYLVLTVLVALLACPVLLALDTAPKEEAGTATASSFGESHAIQAQDSPFTESVRRMVERLAGLREGTEKQGRGGCQIESPHSHIGVLIEPNGLAME